MRQLLIICAIITQLLGYFSAEAKDNVQSKPLTELKAAYSVGSVFHENFPSEVTSSACCSHLFFKIRYQRTIADITNWHHDPSLVSRAGVFSSAYASPLYIPLIRMLLFPNHYFW
jgi:hypothetical protein